MTLFFADECVAALIVDGLRHRGYDIVSAYDLEPGRIRLRPLPGPEQN